eukprot:7780607-Pyramimonas_sp.AAC.1
MGVSSGCVEVAWWATVTVAASAWARRDARGPRPQGWFSWMRERNGSRTSSFESRRVFGRLFEIVDLLEASGGVSGDLWELGQY